MSAEAWPLRPWPWRGSAKHDARVGGAVAETKLATDAGARWVPAIGARRVFETPLRMYGMLWFVGLKLNG
jgi:hypothetical protein